MSYDPNLVSCPLLSAEDVALARRVAPVIRFSANEPFLPSHMGVTIVTAPRTSPSCRLDIAFEPGVARVIEYAIWWDWDIGHLYELEHVWIKLDADDQVIAVEASAHGKFFAMQGPDGSLPLEDGRVTLYSEPGKHAFHATAEAIVAKRRDLSAACRELAGRGNILVNHMFENGFSFSAQQHRAVRRHLESRAFTPSFTFSKQFDTADLEVVNWPGLHAYIAARVPALVAEVEASQPLIKAVMIDSGDTMVDESTEQHDADGYVISADLIPGALDMVEALAAEGYRLILVADGRLKSFETVLGGHGIRDHLHAEIISEVLNVQKPDAAMFTAALEAANLTLADAHQTVMIGNHLERDIAGANQLGITSIWQSWSHKRSRVATTPDEVPDFVARTPGEVAAILSHIENAMARRKDAAAVGSELTSN